MRLWQRGDRALKRILVAGFSTRHVVESAKKAGFEVYAVDHFCDADLRGIADGFIRFEDDGLKTAIDEACGRFNPEGIIPTSGCEGLCDLKIPILGTDPVIAGKYLDKKYTQFFFEQTSLPVPKIFKSPEFPAMLKPCHGSGGWRNRIVHSQEDIISWEEEFPDEPYILQEVVEGIPASVCCVANGKEARAIAINRQIMRGTDECTYGFAGSVTPFNHPLKDEMIKMAETAAAASGCRGIIGIDFIAGKNCIWIIELNPRFVATLDTIEMATGQNLVSMHMRALENHLPDFMPVPVQTAVRSILFAPKTIQISDDLSHLIPKIKDIPVPPAEFEPGEAVISIYGTGKEEEEALKELDTSICAVLQYVH